VSALYRHHSTKVGPGSLHRRTNAGNDFQLPSTKHFHASGDVRAAPQAARDEALKSPIRRREEVLGGDHKPLPNAEATPRKWRGRETATEKTVTGPEKSGNTRLRFRRRPGILRKRAATPAGEHRTRERPVSKKSQLVSTRVEVDRQNAIRERINARVNLIFP
jgi:hypothetical protein